MTRAGNGRSRDEVVRQVNRPTFGRMNPPLAVVDPSLRVHGVPGLRVADASVMPAVTSGNTNAATIMIGERCADIILTATDVPARAAAVT